MINALDVFRQMTPAGVMARLLLATLSGGLIGFERARKQRAAGFRTYMLVCIGAALTLLLGQYQYALYNGPWQALISHVSASPDVARYGAQVVNGIGFLGAGTIIFTGRREVIGLTTAAGLWASACMGLAIGAGFYEAAVLAMLLIVLSMRVLSRIESGIVSHTRNINLYVEFDSIKNLGGVIAQIKKMDVRIYHVDVDTDAKKDALSRNAVFYIRMYKPMAHADMISQIAALESVRSVYEL